MGLIYIDLFTTLDGVAQAPGGPNEDTDQDFKYGGWQAPLIDDLVGEQVDAGMAKMDALLLGRRTYDIFAGYWPTAEEGPITEKLNRLPKYVASRQPRTLEWHNSRQLGPNTEAEIRKLRDQHNHIHVIGSLDLVQTLIAHKLFDILTLWVYPIVLGHGKKVFAHGAMPTSLRLTQPAVTSPNGAVMLRYMRSLEAPHVGDMAAQH
ncbi:dihydrofolate reductase family protein [Leucobacter sp. HY1910]